MIMIVFSIITINAIQCKELSLFIIKIEGVPYIHKNIGPYAYTNI